MIEGNKPYQGGININPLDKTQQRYMNYADQAMFTSKIDALTKRVEALEANKDTVIGVIASMSKAIGDLEAKEAAPKSLQWLEDAEEDMHANAMAEAGYKVAKPRKTLGEIAEENYPPQIDDSPNYNKLMWELLAQAVAEAIIERHLQDNFVNVAVIAAAIRAEFK